MRGVNIRTGTLRGSSITTENFRSRKDTIARPRRAMRVSASYSEVLASKTPLNFPASGPRQSIPVDQPIQVDLRICRGLPPARVLQDVPEQRRRLRRRPPHPAAGAGVPIAGDGAGGDVELVDRPLQLAGGADAHRDQRDPRHRITGGDRAQGGPEALGEAALLVAIARVSIGIEVWL